MAEPRRRFRERPLGVGILAFSHLLFGAACLYLMMAYGLMEGFWESIALGFGMMAVGALSTGILTHLNGRFKWLWVFTFSILPFAYVIPSYFRFVEIGDPFPLKFWISYPISVVLACYIGAITSGPVVWWYRTWKPIRKRPLHTIIRWLS